MKQFPEPSGYLLKWRGDTLKVKLELGEELAGRAFLRTDIGRAHIVRGEIIDRIEKGTAPMQKAWRDLPLKETAKGVFEGEFALEETGVFSGKTCFFPEGSDDPKWPEGGNFRVKVEGECTLRNNAVYSVFPRQFGSFREVKRRLGLIMDEMGFKIIQTLPPFPVPTSYAVMGKMGCPFAALDFFSVDPSLAEFDRRATPLDQFVELMDAVHAKGGLFFIDLPANHTGWASTLQTSRPGWFRRGTDGSFVSPGAWGVVWEDLVELDYSEPELSRYMAEVFLFWCRKGVDGFRCDAGYMIPADTWKYIVAKVREEYPDTVFMLEGLGGDIAVTDGLLADAGIDWAYSEIFQTYDRAAFEWYLPSAAARSEKFGTLVHFAETHDNDRLALKGETYARLRVQLAALLSWQGAWGIANGVEWFCREKIDVHDKNPLGWGAERNMVALVSKLNLILRTEPSFSGACRLSVITRSHGNTLSVLREGAVAADDILVLANLDCERPSDIEWQRDRFPAAEAFDLVGERHLPLSAPVRLAPGEVLCLKKAPSRKGGRGGKAVTPAVVVEESPFRWRYPSDIRRFVAVPAGQTLVFSAPAPFRITLSDPVTGKTLRSLKSSGNVSSAVMPPYRGDGSKSRILRLEAVVYAKGGVERAESRLLVPPPPDEAKVKTAMTGEEIRRNPSFRAVLSNKVSSSSSMRAGWGRIESQYDAFLSANPDPAVPSDRLNLWARTRVWLQHEGFVREFDSVYATSFAADPAGRFARWEFVMPCGAGRSAGFAFDADISRASNAVRLRISRFDTGKDDVEGPLRVVLRPDIEWRSFHCKTKAFTGPEKLFPGAVSSRVDGFSFRPYEGSFEMSVDGGVFHCEPQWTYNVAHPEEADRGQEGAGDLFSPGWISCDVTKARRVTLTGSYVRKGEKPQEAVFARRSAVPAPVLSPAAAAGEAVKLYIVDRDRFKTVIAGYPWFLDWGRDTFIFMRGMIASGMIKESLAILKAFAAFEEKGTLPNIIHGTEAGNRDTTDAPLWFIRLVSEISAPGIKPRVPAQDLRRLRSCCDSIVDNYLLGTPNSIRVDPGSSLVWSPSHFSWMDTNYPACTPRAGYPVEIQALWISALEFLGRRDLADRARSSVERYFKRANGYADCLVQDEPLAASSAVPDASVRPNQLLLCTLGVIVDRSIPLAVSELVLPGSIRSLSASDPLYRGEYSGDEDTSRKLSYHNGTAWGWMFPLWAEALVECGCLSAEEGLGVLSSAVENFNSGCLCHMSEIADGDAPHRQRGCAAQAWSDSEFLRVWLKLGGR